MAADERRQRRRRRRWWRRRRRRCQHQQQQHRHAHTLVHVCVWTFRASAPKCCMVYVWPVRECWLAAGIAFVTITVNSFRHIGDIVLDVCTRIWHFANCSHSHCIMCATLRRAFERLALFNHMLFVYGRKTSSWKHAHKDTRISSFQKCATLSNNIVYDGIIIVWEWIFCHKPEGKSCVLIWTQNVNLSTCHLLRSHMLMNMFRTVRAIVVRLTQKNNISNVCRKCVVFNYCNLRHHEAAYARNHVFIMILQAHIVVVIIHSRCLS